MPTPGPSGPTFFPLASLPPPRAFLFLPSSSAGINRPGGLGGWVKSPVMCRSRSTFEIFVCVCVCVCVCELSRLLKIVVIRDCRCSKFRDSRLSLERCCVLLIFSCFFVTFSAMVFEVFVQEKVRSTWRLVEVACFSRCPARFFASFPAFSKPKIDGKQRNLPEYTFIFYFKN